MYIEKKNSNNNNNNIDIFNFTNVNDYMEIISYYSSMYNGLCNINITENKYDTISSKNNFNHLDELINTVKTIPLDFFGIITFEDIDRRNYYMINSANNTITKLKEENNEIVNNNDSVEYYKDGHDNIIKYDSAKEIFYLLDLDGKTWIRRNDYMDKYYNGDLIKTEYEEGEKRL